MNLCGLALSEVLALRNADADDASRRAIALLEPLEPGPELARAYRVQAQLRMLDRDCEEAVGWAQKALELAPPTEQARCRAELERYSV